jgi:hypothetical protein
MKNSITIARFLCGLLVLLGGVATVSSQTAQVAVPASEGLVVYAKAGRINFAEGEVRSRRTDNDTGKPVATAYEIAVGDIISTGADARLEVLLNPGSFLRVGENAEFQMLSTDLENIHFVLRRGSALIEAGGNKDFVSRMRISTPSGLAYLSSRGLYRVDIVPEGTVFAAIKGTLTLGSKTITLRDGERVTVTGNGAGQVAKLEKSFTPDPLESWSHDRADRLAAASRRMNREKLAAAMRRAAASNIFVSSLRGQAGIWGADGSGGSYTFIPVLRDWRSPYGFGYANLSASSMGRYSSGFYTGMVPGPRGIPTPPMRLQDPKPPPPPPPPPRAPGTYQR